MTLEVRSVDKLKGQAPQTKLWHLYKTVTRRNLPIHLVEPDLLITAAVVDELMRFDAKAFGERKDCPGKRVMLQLRKSRESGPCRNSVTGSFKEETQVLETALVLFFLLVRGESVDTNDPAFLEV
jgi:hypothetical protein